jgi:large subunit ribosomal protein L25
MSAVKQIKASARASGGKGAARAVRRSGLVPAVVYGGGEAALPIALDFATTNRMIYAGHFKTTIFEIDVDGQKVRAIPRDFQLDPVRDTVLHVDFLRLSGSALVRVVVPIHVSGQEQSAGVKRGGLVQIVEHSLELMAPGDAILNDIVLPAGCKAITRDNITLVSVTTPTKLVEAAPAPAAAPAKA